MLVISLVGRTDNIISFPIVGTVKICLHLMKRLQLVSLHVRYAQVPIHYLFNLHSILSIKLKLCKTTQLPEMANLPCG